MDGIDWPSFSLTGFLDWLDEAAGGLIRLAYLAAGVTAVAVYFGAGQLPANVDQTLNAALPWALAFALETHTYLTARRVRAAWQERDRAGLQVNIGVLAVLLAFSAWNQLGYLSGVWTPPHTGPLALPLWAAYAVRALIVPAAFMAAAFLAPLAPPITAQIEGEARATLADVFKIARKQRKRMLKEAQASGRDLTGALVELVSDDTTRRIIAHAYHAIRAPEQPVTSQTGIDAPERIEATTALPTAASAGANAAASAGADDPSIVTPAPDRPPTGPGSPAVASRQLQKAAAQAASAANVTPMRRSGLGKPPRQNKRISSRANGSSGKRGTVQKRIRALLAQEPDLTQDAVVARLGVSPSSASKWMAVIEAERMVQQRAAQ